MKCCKCNRFEAANTYRCLVVNRKVQYSQADEVRAVGRKLADAGGMDLMLEAHAAFARQNGRMARNLEMVWDGIGGWAG